MHNFCLHPKEFQSIYVYKGYAYKESMDKKGGFVLFACKETWSEQKLLKNDYFHSLKPFPK